MCQILWRQTITEMILLHYKEMIWFVRSIRLTIKCIHDDRSIRQTQWSEWRWNNSIFRRDQRFEWNKYCWWILSLSMNNLYYSPNAGGDCSTNDWSINEYCQWMLLTNIPVNFDDSGDWSANEIIMIVSLLLLRVDTLWYVHSNRSVRVSAVSF